MITPPPPRSALEFQTIRVPKCGCTVEGAGTLRDPITIVFCPAHQTDGLCKCGCGQPALWATPACRPRHAAAELAADIRSKLPGGAR